MCYGVGRSLSAGTSLHNGRRFTDNAGPMLSVITGYELTGSSRTSPLKCLSVLAPWNMLYWTRDVSCLIWIVTKIRTQLVGTIGAVFTASGVLHQGNFSFLNSLHIYYKANSKDHSSLCKPKDIHCRTIDTIAP